MKRASIALVGMLDVRDYKAQIRPDGWMPIFDEDKSKSWDEKLYNRDIKLNGKTLHIVGL